MRDDLIRARSCSACLPASAALPLAAPRRLRGRCSDDCTDLMLWGGHDPWQTISDGERLAREIPECALVRVWKMHRIGVPTIHLRDSQSRCATFSPLVEGTQKSDAAGHVRGRDSSEGEYQAAKIVEEKEAQRGKAPTRS